MKRKNTIKRDANEGNVDVSDGTRAATNVALRLNKKKGKKK